MNSSHFSLTFIYIFSSEHFLCLTWISFPHILDILCVNTFLPLQALHVTVILVDMVKNRKLEAPYYVIFYIFMLFLSF